MNKVTTLTNLSLTGSNDYNLVVGLPIGQYKTQKDKFRKMIMAYNDSEVIFQGKQMHIKTNDVYVLPQGIGALLSLNEINGNVIIIDWGGLTIDIAYLEIVNGYPILHKFDTWTNGIQKIYSKLINAVNEKYNLTRDITFSENILVNGLFINGEKVALDFLTSTVREYIDPIVTELKINYPVANTSIYLTGGTSTISLVTDMFKTYFPHAKLMPNSQFANAIGYGKVAEQKFGAISIPVCNYRR
jgi:plasmid segregation protein ParM